MTPFRDRARLVEIAFIWHSDLSMYPHPAGTVPVTWGIDCFTKSNLAWSSQQ